MSGSAVDVSDPAQATPACTTPPKSVTWRQHLVASEVVGTLAALEPADLARVWPELWVTSDEIAMARCQARLDRIAFPRRMTSITPRTYAGHKRPAMDDLSAAAQLHTAASETAAARGLLSTSDGVGGRTSVSSVAGLCLNRAVLNSVSSSSGCAVSPPPGRPFSASASPAASMGAGPSTAPASLPCSQPACGQPPTSAAGLCLQRGSMRGLPHGFEVVRGTLPHELRHAASAPLVPPHPRRRSSANPQTGRRHTASQPGLSMSQRVAALQIGSPATYVHSSVPPLLHSSTHP